MADYTKGEWQREPVNDQMIAVLEMDEEAGFETWKYIAEVDPCGDKRFTNEECEANAQLIASSPRMIEFIQQLANNGNQEAKDFIQTLDLS